MNRKKGGSSRPLANEKANQRQRPKKQINPPFALTSEPIVAVYSDLSGKYSMITMDSNKTIGATFSPDLVDGDNDGLTNFDELVIYGSDPLKADTDRDGFDDLFEVNTGFSPTSASSTPDAVSGIATAVKFHFNAANGVSYRIEQSTDLQTWTVLETGIVGTGGVVKRYFRVRRE